MTSSAATVTAPAPALASVVHCVYREGLAGVFLSQVLAPVQAYRLRGMDVRLALFTAVGEWLRAEPRHKWVRQMEAITAAAGNAVVRLPSPPARARWAWNDRIVFRRWLARQSWNGGVPVLHCRGATMTGIALDALPRRSSARIIFDCRGADPAEYLLDRGRLDDKDLPADVQRDYDQRRDAERRAAVEADAVICVTDRMAEHLVSEHGISPRKLTVSPCCVEVSSFASAAARRDETRRELGIADRFVIVFCGGLQSWQCPEQSARLFRSVLEHDPSAYLLALTPQAQTMRRVLDAAGIGGGDSAVLAVPHAQVARYLAAGDAGLLLRQRSMVNEVASPVKFAEYLASGLPVIITEGVGDYSRLVQSEGAGLMLERDADHAGEDPQLPGWIKRYKLEMPGVRQRCRAVAEARLSRADHIEKVMALYRDLSSDGPGSRCTP